MPNVKIEDNQGAIRIRVQLQGKRYAFAPIARGKYYNKRDYKQAELLAKQIELDILQGTFDTTLSKYKDDTSKTPTETKYEAQNLSTLWPKFVEYKRGTGLADSSLYVDYVKRVGNMLPKLPSLSLEDSIDIRDWILENKPPQQARKIMLRLSECGAWAVDSHLIKENPFEKMTRSLSRNIQRTAKEGDIDPFSKEERDEIIQAFNLHHCYNHYTSLVEFLFYVGCRPSEALALRWQDVEQDRIHFSYAYVLKKTKEGLKTQKTRIININHQVREVLEKAKQQQNHLEIIFTTPRGERINWDSFNHHAWRKIMSSLPHIRYRPPYQMRHTYITLLVQSGEPLTDIAKLCGNSPRTILENYAGITRNYVPPVI